MPKVKQLNWSKLKPPTKVIRKYYGPNEQKIFAANKRKWRDESADHKTKKWLKKLLPRETKP